MVVVFVDLAEVETELWAYLFTEVLLQLGDLAWVADWCVSALCDLLFLCYLRLGVEKCWVGYAVGWFLCQVYCVVPLVQLCLIWLWACLVIYEDVQRFCPECSSHVLFWKGHWNLGQEEIQIDKCPCCFFKYQGWVRIHMIRSRLYQNRVLG